MGMFNGQYMFLLIIQFISISLQITAGGWTNASIIWIGITLHDKEALKWNDGSYAIYSNFTERVRHHLVLRIKYEGINHIECCFHKYKCGRSKEWQVQCVRL